MICVSIYLDTAGDPSGLGVELTGVHAQVWQAIVAQLEEDL